MSLTVDSCMQAHMTHVCYTRYNNAALIRSQAVCIDAGLQTSYKLKRPLSLHG